MASLGRGQYRGDGFGVAHLTHQNDVGVLTQDASKRTGEVMTVVPDLDLLKDRLAVDVVVLDRVLDGDHVVGIVLIDESHQRGQRRRLARPGRPRHQNQTLLALGELGERRGQMQRLECGDLRRQQPYGRRQRATLKVDVGAKSPDALAHEAEIARAPCFQLLAARRRQHRQHQLVDIVVIEHRSAAVQQAAVDTQHDGAAGHQEQVRRAALDRLAQHGIERVRIDRYVRLNGQRHRRGYR